MRALVIHISEGSTHVLLASTRRKDLEPSPRERPKSILEGAALPDEEPKERHDQLFVMHDHEFRNGADLSLLYMGHVQEDLRANLLRQAAEEVQQFRTIADSVTVSMSASLLPDATQPDEDPVVAEFQHQTGMDLRVLPPADEALWQLRGVRGIYPSGELACVSVGFWNSYFAHEVPGRVPRLLSLKAGTSRALTASHDANRRCFPELESLAHVPLCITGEHAWLVGALQIGLTFHDTDLLDETEVTPADLRTMEGMLAGLSEANRNLIPMVDKHGDSMLEAVRLFRTFLLETQSSKAQVCSRGVAHGLVSHMFFEGRRRG